VPGRMACRPRGGGSARGDGLLICRCRATDLRAFSDDSQEPPGARSPSVPRARCLPRKGSGLTLPAHVPNSYQDHERTLIKDPPATASRRALSPRSAHADYASGAVPDTPQLAPAVQRIHRRPAGATTFGDSRRRMSDQWASGSANACMTCIMTTTKRAFGAGLRVTDLSLPGDSLDSVGKSHPFSQRRDTPLHSWSSRYLADLLWRPDRYPEEHLKWSGSSPSREAF
jgi:hypothetical protein